MDTVEVLELDQWLALLIIGDLDPFTPAPSSPASRHPHRKSEEPHWSQRVVSDLSQGVDGLSRTWTDAGGRQVGRVRAAVARGPIQGVARMDTSIATSLLLCPWMSVSPRPPG